MAQNEVEIRGITEFLATLKNLEEKSGKRIGNACVTRMAGVYASGIRKEIKKSIRPKTSDRGIGYSVLKNKGKAFGAKVGVGVGKARKNSLKIVNRGKRKGVGVSANNLIWFGLGTKKRYTGSVKSGNERRFTPHKRHYTGFINKAKWGGFIESGIRKSEAKAFEAAEKTFQRKLPQEVDAARR